MQLGGKYLRGVGATNCVARERWRRGGGRGGGVSQGGQRDVAGRFAARRAVLAVEFGRQAVQGAGPHVFKFWLRAVTSHVCVMTSHGERGATTDLINPGPGTYVPTLKHRQRNRADLGQQGRRL